MSALTVLRSGPLLTVQDAGRPGYAHLGVPRAGAVDREALAAANRLVGNEEDAAGLEATATGCTLRAGGEVVVAVAGAPCPLFVGGVRAPWGAPIRLGDGQVLEIAPPIAGLRTYVAVRGGVDVPATLGSRSADVLSGIGPAPLADGDSLAVAHAPPAHPGLFGAPALTASIGLEATLAVRLGPRADWFTGTALETLTTATYTVSDRSNRIGLRLDGDPLERARDGELASEGMVLGAVQVPPEGRPIVFLADHPTTGGYPVIGVVARESLSAAAQAAPGTAVRFVAQG